LSFLPAQLVAILNRHFFAKSEASAQAEFGTVYSFKHFLLKGWFLQKKFI
jgi:hypothetical protein